MGAKVYDFNKFLDSRRQYPIGTVVRHGQFRYRAVVIAVDDSYKGEVCTGKAQKGRWYHLLIDGRGSPGYVPEGSLMRDPRPKPIEHPLTNQFFERFQNGRYI